MPDDNEKNREVMSEEARQAYEQAIFKLRIMARQGEDAQPNITPGGLFIG